MTEASSSRVWLLFGDLMVSSSSTATVPVKNKPAGLENDRLANSPVGLDKGTTSGSIDHYAVSTPVQRNSLVKLNAGAAG
jgi:hypothetical protein